MEEDSATHKNILAIKDHSIRSREIVRELEAKLEDTNKENRDLKNKLKLMQEQIQMIQVKLFSGGATSQ